MKHQDETGANATRNLLAYLGRIPARLAKSNLHDPVAKRLMAETALDIGNALLWVQPGLAPGEPHHEQPLNECAQSLWALGKQFRAVGLALWDTPPAEPSEMERLRHEVESMARELERLGAAVRGREAFAGMHAAVERGPA